MALALVSSRLCSYSRSQTRGGRAWGGRRPPPHTSASQARAPAVHAAGCVLGETQRAGGHAVQHIAVVLQLHGAGPHVPGPQRCAGQEEAMGRVDVGQQSPQLGAALGQAVDSKCGRTRKPWAPTCVCSARRQQPEEALGPLGPAAAAALAAPAAAVAATLAAAAVAGGCWSLLLLLLAGAGQAGGGAGASHMLARKRIHLILLAHLGERCRSVLEQAGRRCKP